MSQMGTRGSWIKRFTPVPGAHGRLICFAHAGGSALSFREWSTWLPGVEVLCVQPPGREERLGEPPLREVGAVVDSLLEALRPWLDRPFAFFGHSLGTLQAYEMAQRLRQVEAPQPAHLLVSAHRAPHLPPSRRVLHALPQAEFVSELRRLGGTPSAVFDVPELLELIGPTIRADLEMTERYEWRELPPLDCPITAFGGTEDDRVDPHEVRQWDRHTRARFESHFFPGGHFYLREHLQPLLRHIHALLTPGPLGQSQAPAGAPRPPEPGAAR
jgi:medium-chain acyl-[acyl-carrier-protein] hydrolase